MSFAELNVWTFIMVIATLLLSMLIAGALKYFIPALKKTLIPVSVLGGILLLVISTVVYFAAGDYLFNLAAYGDGSDGSMTGMEVLELITYHCLGIGFIASGMRNSKKKFTKKRAGEIFDSGVTTVNGYLIQAFAGLIITLVAVWGIGTDGMISAAGILLAFGFGQGTGQALNYGKIYENEYGFEGGANFGLTVAALGFLVACIGGVIYINVMRRKGKITIDTSYRRSTLADYEDENEIPAVSSVDKMTVQWAIVLGIYALSFGIMYGLSLAFDSLADTLFGFNFLIGVILISWGMAFFEYCAQVPANRLGFEGNGGPFSLMQLKVIQEVVTLVIFTLFTVVFFRGEPLHWNHLAAAVCLVLAVYFVFMK